MVCIINDVKYKLIQHPPFFKHRSRERQILSMIQSGDYFIFALRKKNDI